MADIVAVEMGKGGVGKTEVAVNLARAIAGTGRSVLMVDGDPEGHLTGTRLGVYAADVRIRLDDLMLNGAGPKDLQDALVEVGSMHLLPCLREPDVFEQQLVSMRRREERLSDLLDQYAHVFDVIVIDTSPGLMTIMNDNILYALRRREGIRSGVIMVVKPDAYSAPDIPSLQDRIVAFQREMRVRIPFAGLVLNHHNPSRGSMVRGAAGNLLGLGLPLLHGRDRGLGERAVFSEAVAARKPVADYAPDSDPVSWFADMASRLDANLDRAYSIDPTTGDANG